MSLPRDLSLAVVSPLHGQPSLSWRALAVVLLLHAMVLAAGLASRAGMPLPEVSAPMMVEVLAADPAPEKKATQTLPRPQPPAQAVPTRKAAAEPVLATPSLAPEAEVMASPKTPQATPIAVPTPQPSAQGGGSPVPALVATSHARAPQPATAAEAHRFDADYLDNPKPTYPPISRREREQGKVLLNVHVDASGAADQVSLHNSSGFERLDKAAMAAVRRWRFVPSRQGGDALAAWVVVPIVFSLKD